MQLMKVDFDILKNVKNALLSMQRHDWEQGCAAQAFLEWGDADMAVRMARSAVMRQNKDGRLGMMGRNESVNDPAAVGEALLFAYEQTGDALYKAAADKLLAYLLHRAPKTTDGVLFHFNSSNQVWVDAFYMSPPFLARAGEYDEALKQIKGFRKYLYNEQQRLHSHIWDDDLQALTRKGFWGVGNGWAIAGLTRVIAALPPQREAEWEYLIDYVTNLIDGCLAYQREDGLYHNTLDDPESFADTNVSQMIAYGIYRGVAAGYLSESYLPSAEKSRAAAYAKVDRYGFVTEVCGLPCFKTASLAPEGQVFFMLMEAAAYDLMKARGAE